MAALDVPAVAFVVGDDKTLAAQARAMLRPPQQHVDGVDVDAL